MDLRKTAALLLASCMAGAVLTACSAATLSPEEVVAPYYPDDDKGETVILSGVKYCVYKQHAELIGFTPQYIHATFEIPSTVENRPVTAIRRGANPPAILATLTIPDSVRIIDAGAFSGCTNLETITFPDSLTYIGEDAFEDTPWLASQAASSSDGLIVTGSVLIDGKNAYGDISIPNTVVSLSPGAFRGNEHLTSISLPASVAVIGDEAFIGCTELTKIRLPGSLMQIGDGAFRNTGLEIVSLPGSLTEIGDSAFEDCDKLTRIDIPGSLTSVGKNAFCGCTSLASIELPAGVESIGENAFASCDALSAVFIFAKECEIYNSRTTFSNADTCVIYAPVGSTGNAYALQFDYDYKKI